MLIRQRRLNLPFETSSEGLTISDFNISGLSFRNPTLMTIEERSKVSRYKVNNDYYSKREI